jgi:hypothetical protein
MKLSFSQHGEFDLSLQGNIIVARLHGSWNEEAAEAFEHEFIKLASQLIDKPWGHLVYFDDWDLGVPEINPIIERLVTWCIQNNLKRAAQIYGASLVKKHFIDIMIVEQFGEFQRQAFIEETLAVEWLASGGFTLNE